MTSACLNTDGIQIRLSRSEALVFFEWLSRNWEKGYWKSTDLFSDPAEMQLLISFEADLQKILSEPFDPNYKDLVQKSYRELVPERGDWE